MKGSRDRLCTHTSAFRVAVVYFGCCVGAGYLSGQELFQFFGAKGAFALPSLLLATIAIFLIGSVTLSLARDTGEARMDRLVIWFDCKPLRTVVAAFEIVFLFMIYTLCVAAFGSFFSELLGVSAFWGGLFLCLACTFLSLFGVKGLSRFCSLVVPPLALITVAIALLAVCTAKDIRFTAVDVGGFLTGAWGFDGLTYAVFCLFCALPVLIPLGSTISGKKTAWRGSFFGAFLIGCVACVILLALATSPAVTETVFPMLALSLEKSTVLGAIYAALLCVAILSASLSSLCAMSEGFMQRFSQKKRFLLPVTALISITALALGLFGFRELIGVLYPIFGYIGFIPMGLLLVHAFLFYRKKKKKT